MRSPDNVKLGILGLVVATAIVALHALFTVWYYYYYYFSLHARRAGAANGNDTADEGHEDDATAYFTDGNCASASVILTYDNRGLNDGAGAQAQRILSLYLIAKWFAHGVGYLHSPIAKVIYQGLDALAENVSSPGYESRWNEAFALPSFRTAGCGLDQGQHGTTRTTTKAASAMRPARDNIGDSICIHVRERSLASLEAVRKQQRKSCRLGAPIVLHVTFAHEVTDAHPELLNTSGAFQGVLPWIGQLQQQQQHETAPINNDNNTITSDASSTRHRRKRVSIAIHVRRGDLQFRQAHRMLPNAYYVAVARELGRIFEDLRLPWEIDLFTEALLAQPVTICPNQVGLEPGELARPIKIRPDRSLSRDFADLGNINNNTARMRINGDALEAMKALVAADVLVISPSSFSYVAGLLRPPGDVLVIYSPFWHAPRSDWFRMSPFDYGSAGGGTRHHQLRQDDAQQLRAKIVQEFETKWRRRAGSAPPARLGRP